MKKSILFLLSVIVIILSSCTVDDEIYTVRFVVNNEDYFEVNTVEGTTVLEPDTPLVEGNEFLGWYSDSLFAVAYDFSKPVIGDLNLHAKWGTKEYTITFYYGDDDPQDIQVLFEEDLSILFRIFEDSKEVEELLFYKDSEYIEEYDNEIMPSHDISVYAKQEIIVIQEPDTIKFGLIGPLDGPYGLYGTSVMNGAQLAIDEINAAGGILGLDLELISYDAEGDPSKAVNAYNILIEEDKIDALIGGVFSGETLGFKPLAIVEGIPVLTPTATHPEITSDAENIFRLTYTNSYQGSVAAIFVDEILEVQTVVVLNNTYDAYSQELATAFIAEAELRGLTVLEYTYSSLDDDYTTTLTSINESNAEAVFLPGYVLEVGNILTQAIYVGLDIPFVGGDGWDGLQDDFLGVIEGHYFLNHYSETDLASFVQDFVTNYEAKYEETPNALAALAYDAVYAMVLAMENAESIEYVDVVAALANINMLESVTGSIGFDENGDSIKNISIIQFISGEQVVIAKISKQD